MARIPRPAMLVLLGALVLALAAPAGAQERAALVRVVHFGFGAPTLDAWIDGDKVIPRLTFKAASRYVDLAPGSHKVELRQAGADADAEPVAAGTASVKAGRPYTVAFLGKPGAYETAQVSDDFTLPPRGMARLRLLNANPDSPGVDVTTPGGVMLVKDVRYRHASPYVTVKAGQPFAGNVLQTGTSNVLLSTEGTEPLPPGAVITVVGARTAAGVETVSILDAAGSGSVPKGGIATGGGGTASGGTAGLWPLGAALVLLVGLSARPRRRGPQGSRPG